VAKTIRFGDLVRQSGRPEAVTLWTDPKKDRSFSKAMKENRVVTVYASATGQRKDYGEIGFHEERGATYLVFPRALPKTFESRIVGINYQLAEDTPIKGPLVKPKQSKDKRAKAKKKASSLRIRFASPEKAATEPAKPTPQIFEIIIRRTAVLEEVERVKAFTEEEAKERALHLVKHKRFVLSRAVQREEVRSATGAKPASCASCGLR
jgi:hypothetical protein